jgi:hypothetical protein
VTKANFVLLNLFNLDVRVLFPVNYKSRLLKLFIPEELIKKIEDAFSKIVDGKEYTTFVSQTLPLDFGLPTFVCPPNVIQTLFLGVDRQVVLLTLHSDKDVQDKTIFYTINVASSLEEYLHKICNTDFLTLCCCIQIDQFEENPIESLRTEVDARLNKLLSIRDRSKPPSELDRHRGVLTQETYSEVVRAAVYLVGATRVPNVLQNQEQDVRVSKGFCQLFLVQLGIRVIFFVYSTCSCMNVCVCVCVCVCECVCVCVCVCSTDLYKRSTLGTFFLVLYASHHGKEVAGFGVFADRAH